jgi:hypothetical protein
VGRRWKWVVLGAIVGAVVGVAIPLARTDAWVAESLVVLTDASIPPEEFADVADAIFPTDSVLGPVVDELGIEGNPRSLIANGALTLQPAPGGLAVRIVARTQDGSLSVALANAAASRFADVGEENGLGSMAQFPSQEPRRQRDPLVRSAATGALAGAFAVALLLALLALLRERPRTEDERLDAAMTFRVRVDPSPTADRTQPVRITPSAFLPALLEAMRDGSSGAVGLVIDDGPAVWAVLAVAEELTDLAARAPQPGSFRWSPASEPPTGKALERVIVIAPDGARARLDDVRAGLRASSPAAVVALVLVSAPDLS